MTELRLHEYRFTQATGRTCGGSYGGRCSGRYLVQSFDSQRALRYRWFRGGFFMHNEFTAIFERDGDWIVAYCPEIPGANGQGRSKEEARTSLSEAIALILEDRRADAFRGVPSDAERGTVTVE
jgi:predicted RNase H-like HicB family nuclease